MKTKSRSRGVKSTVIWQSSVGPHGTHEHVVFDPAQDISRDPEVTKLPTVAGFRTAAEALLASARPGSREEHHADSLEGKAVQAEQWQQSGDADIDDVSDAHNVIDKLIFCSAADRRAVPLLCGVVEYALRQLHNLAVEKKDRAAQSQLVVLLSCAVERLDQAAASRPRMFRSAATQLPAFPVLGSNFAARESANRQLIKLLGVGEDYWWQQHRMPRSDASSKSGKAKHLVFRLIQYLEQYQHTLSSSGETGFKRPSWTETLRALRPLGPKTWRKWMELVWEVVLESSRGKPGSIPNYRAIAKRTSRTDAYGKMTDVSRDGIRQALQDALQELVIGKSSRHGQKR